ncbi:MAG: response regulator transcription factor [Tissierellia bacterium]|nr:response regulator transcription factor [Tissierellia bacterium]
MIYCIEDDKNIQDLIVYTLEANKYEAIGFNNGQEMMEKLPNKEVELILLDIMLPEEDGISIMKKIRGNPETSDIPIILLTAKSSEVDKIVGLDEGADDYITKPFSVLELVSRIKALLRRTSRQSEDQIYKFKGISVDVTKRDVRLGDEKINLTFKEFELLLYLLKNKEIVLTRENIINEVWGFDFEGESRTVDVHIATLRQKLKEWSKYIHTIRNLGYKIGETA